MSSRDLKSGWMLMIANLSYKSNFTFATLFYSRGLMKEKDLSGRVKLGLFSRFKYLRKLTLKY